MRVCAKSQKWKQIYLLVANCQITPQSPPSGIRIPHPSGIGLRCKSRHKKTTPTRWYRGGNVKPFSATIVSISSLVASRWQRIYGCVRTMRSKLSLSRVKPITLIAVSSVDYTSDAFFQASPPTPLPVERGEHAISPCTP